MEFIAFPPIHAVCPAHHILLHSDTVKYKIVPKYLFVIVSAEFGNHDLERHTAEYLKDFALFPKVTSITAD